MGTKAGWRTNGRGGLPTTGVCACCEISIGRYRGNELRWYRALGIGTKPSRVLRQGRVEVLNRRGRLPGERKTLPKSIVVIECRVEGETVTLGLDESAYTGFVSWLESSAPRA